MSKLSEALQDLPKDEETTMEDNWKWIKEVHTSTCQEVLSLNKHHHKEWISIESPDKIQENENKKKAINDRRTSAEKANAQAEYIEANKQRNRWVEHLEELLNRPALLNPPDIEAGYIDLPIDVTLPTNEKIRMVIRQIKGGKTEGPDNMPAEALKSEIKEDLRGRTTADLPERRTPLQNTKEQDLNKLLLNWVKHSVDAQLRDQRAGFRKNWSCIDQIATLCITTEQSVECNFSLCVSFIIYQKAFDNVDRRTLWKLLRHYGAPEKIVSIPLNSYDRLHCKMVHGEQPTDAFQVKTGVR
ncbi:unnamed protein product [Schistosoma curassoni]|uniref:Reverse transcriptase domain-containing protein n=1 Tax=Schistosoma curassoni TaxID=6186 RepID=A0A183K0K8_9TREM|nr:unnamed protein product [Schistosoma curassoni]